jgi:hypothetical protein
LVERLVEFSRHCASVDDGCVVWKYWL